MSSGCEGGSPGEGTQAEGRGSRDGEGLQAALGLLLKKTYDTYVYTQTCGHTHTRMRTRMQAHTYTSLKAGHVTRVSTVLHNNVDIWGGRRFSC